MQIQSYIYIERRFLITAFQDNTPMWPPSEKKTIVSSINTLVGTLFIHLLCESRTKINVYCCNVGLHFVRWFIVLYNVALVCFFIICDTKIQWKNNLDYHSGVVRFVIAFKAPLLSTYWCRAPRNGLDTKSQRQH